MTGGRPVGLLVPAMVAWGVALGVTAGPAAALPLLAVLVPLVPAAVVVAVRVGGRRAALGAAGVVAVAALLAAVVLDEPGRHPRALPTGRPVTALVQVESSQAVQVRSRGSRRMIRGRVRAVVEDGVTTPMDTGVLLFADAADVPAGAVVRGRIVLERSAPTDETAFVGSVRGTLATVRPPPPAERAVGRLRADFRRVTARLPGDGGALLPGLAIGDTSRVDASLVQAMRDASLSHLTAVSGANCAVVVLGVLWLTGRLRLRRGARVIVSGAALAAFVALVGPQPSVVRAAVMAGIALACVLGGRRSGAVPVLALTVLVLLVGDPWLAWNPGFALSVLATGGLLLVAPALAGRIERWVPRRLALLVAVPVAAQAVCQPVLLLLQPGVPVFGVLANLLAEPAAPVVTVLGLIACVTSPLCPPLAAGVALLAWLPAAWIALIARSAAELPRIDWLPGATGALIAAALIAAALIALRRRAPRPVRAGAAVVLAIGLLVLAGGAIGGTVGRLARTPRDWTLAACDVGQGDGLVLNGRGGFAVIDTGREAGPIRSCLDRLGVHRIDLLVLTHWDADHVGAAAALAGRVTTALVGPVDGPVAVRLRATLARAGARVVEARRGDRLRLGTLRIDVLWPPDPLGSVEPGNAASITMAVEGRPSILLTGDLGQEAQDAILAAGPIPAVDVIKVAHHGSSDQSPAFYAAAAATLGVVSVGAGNDYGHPTRRLLSILHATGTLPVRTDEDGLVLVGARQGRLTLWTERPVTAAVWTPAK